MSGVEVIGVVAAAFVTGGLVCAADRHRPRLAGRSGSMFSRENLVQ